MKTDNRQRVSFFLTLLLGISPLSAFAAPPSSEAVNASAHASRHYPHVGPHHDHVGPGVGSVKTPPFHHRRAQPRAKKMPPSESRTLAPNAERVGPGLGSVKTPFRG